MHKKQPTKLLFAGGIVELFIAVLHFVMPLEVGRAEVIAGLPLAYQQYVIHATIAVGLCMTAFGTLSLYFSRKPTQGSQAALIFSLSQAILWSARTLSELVLPIRVPLFFLPDPTVIILPMVMAIALLFWVSTLALRKELLMSSINQIP